jgi:hypothetical protein
VDADTTPPGRTSSTGTARMAHEGDAAADGSAAPIPSRGRTLRWTSLLVLAMTSVLLLLATVMLAGLRSEERTAALGAALADDPAVRELVVDTLVEAAVTELRTQPGVVGLLAPTLTGPLTALGREVLASEPGRGALAAALTDTVRGLTTGGPVVIDLRAAVEAAADAAPEPLASLIRGLVADSGLGVVVLGEPDADPSDAARGAVPAGALAAVTPGTVAGLPAAAAVALTALLAVTAVIGLGAAGRGGPRRRLRAPASVLVSCAGPLAAILLLAPDAVARAFGTASGGDPALAAIVDVVVTGVVPMLMPATLLAVVLTVLGVAAASVSLMAERRTARLPSRPA